MTVIKLHTLASLHVERIPKDDKKPVISLKEFEQLVEQHGTYRLFGKQKFMTESDWVDLIRLTGARRTRPAEPSPNETGLMVFIGHPYDPQCLVFIAWTPFNTEFDLLDQIRLSAQEKVDILNVLTATPEDVEYMKKRHQKSHRFGGWYGRTEELIGDIKRLTDEPIEGDEFEQVPEEAGRDSRAAENSGL